MRRWRDWLPATWRDAVLPRTSRDEPRLPTLPAWQAARSPAASLESGRFEHAGAHHRVQVRAHADGSGLVVADAQRIARLDAAGLARLRSWMSSGAKDAGALEQELWGEPVLTGSGPPRAANAWDASERGAQALPEIPLVATVEIAATPAAGAAQRMRDVHALAIPHVILRPADEGAGAAVVAAVRAAEDLGLVTGVAAPAGLLDDGTLLEDLAAVGLDHLALTIAGDGAALHDAVLGPGRHDELRKLAARAAALETPLTGELPLVDANWTQVAGILAEAARLGMLGVTAWTPVGAAGCVAPAALRQVAATLEASADGSPVQVTWAAPARVRSVEEAVARGPRTDGDFGLRVLGDGSILPPRGSRVASGTLGVSSWTDVAASASWQAFRAQAEKPTRCASCPGLALCAVDCPADEEGWA